MAQIQQEDRINLGAKKFGMWIFIFTSFMFFAALTSGFIVYSGGRGRGLHIILPHAFMYSTACIIVSSITLYMASKAARGLQFAQQRLYLWITIALGIVFFLIQLYGWSQLISMGVYFVNNNASQSFIYVFTGMHLIHIIAGVLLLTNALTGSYKNIPQVRNLFKMEISSIFWHFVDIIWIYLYVFLLLNQN
jgi:cytochrome c oxidase subunit 3